MHVTRIWIVAVAACAAALACASDGGRTERALLAETRSAFEAKDFESAYRRAVQLHAEHAASADDYQAFVIAAQSLKVLFHRDRFREPESPWVTSEPTSLFPWLAAHLHGADGAEAANVFFVGLPYNVLRAFHDYAHARDDLSALLVRAEDDNGIIQSVTVESLAARAP
jgi:hypothetical protein